MGEANENAVFKFGYPEQHLYYPNKAKQAHKKPSPEFLLDVVGNKSESTQPTSTAKPFVTVK